MKILGQLQEKFKEEQRTAVWRDMFSMSGNSGITGDQIATPDHVISEQQQRSIKSTFIPSTSPGSFDPPFINGRAGFLSPLQVSQMPLLTVRLIFVTQITMKSPPLNPTSVEASVLNVGLDFMGKL